MTQAYSTSAPDGGIRATLLIGAIYDGILGILFLVAATPLMDLLGIPMPPNPIYMQLAAGLIAIMGLLQFYAWRDLERNADIIRVLIAFKAFFILLAGWAQLQGELPHPIFGVFALIDVAFLVAFLMYMRKFAVPAR